MKRTLAERSGRTYPHNAIYEILTNNMPYNLRHEPKLYNKRTINTFWKMLNTAGDKTRQAYELVYANGNTLKDAGKIMRVSGSTVKKYLMNIYFVKDKHGYLVSDLDKIAKSSFRENENIRGIKTERIYYFLDKSLPLTSLTKEEATNVLIAYADNVSIIGISEFYHYSMEDVEIIVNAFKDFE